MWGLAPDPMSQSNIGIKGIEPIGAGWSFVFDLEAAFSPYSLRPADGPGSGIRNAGVPLNMQNPNGDGSREGQWYNNEDYAGVSSARYLQRNNIDLTVGLRFRF